MAAPGGARRGPVMAIAPRSSAVAEDEQVLLQQAVVAVVVGSCPSMMLVDVKRALAIRFQAAEDAISVAWKGRATMLFRFADPAVRARVLAVRGPLVLGPVSFNLLPWTRFRSATAAALCYRVRVCLEGVPESDWHWKSISSLFAGEVLFDEVDHACQSEEETACFKIWVWMNDVNRLATKGTLYLEEPVEMPSPEMHFPELGIFAETPPRSGPVKMLTHLVLIHLEWVHDYSPPPTSSSDSFASSRSGISGTPSDTFTPEITKWRYTWNLDFKDGTFPPARPRGSVHSRLHFPGDGGDGEGDGGRDHFGGSAHAGRRTRWDARPAATGGDGRPSLAAGHFSGGHGRAVDPAAVTDRTGKRLTTCTPDLAGARQAMKCAGEVRPGQAANSSGHANFLLHESPAAVGQGAAPLGANMEPAELLHTSLLDLDARGTALTTLPIPKEETLLLPKAKVSSVPFLLHVGLSKEGQCSGSKEDQDQPDLLLGVDTADLAEPAQTSHAPANMAPLEACSVGSILGLDWLPTTGPPVELALDTTQLERDLGAAGSLSGPQIGGKEGSPFVGRPGLLDIIGCGSEGSEKLASFASLFLSPTAAPLICSPPPPPSATPTIRPPPQSTSDNPTPLIRHNGRLAAKPSAGMATMDKVKLVLLKKNSIAVKDPVSKEEGLKRYAEMYKKPLTPMFMGAVSALLDASALTRKEGVGSLAVV